MKRVKIGYFGVVAVKDKWRAHRSFTGGKNVNGINRDTVEEAAMDADTIWRKHGGDVCRLNFLFEEDYPKIESKRNFVKKKAEKKSVKKESEVKQSEVKK